MKRRIVYLSASPDGDTLYATADDGTAWRADITGCAPPGWQQIESLPDSDTPEPKDLWTSEPYTKAKP